MKGDPHQFHCRWSKCYLPLKQERAKFTRLNDIGNKYSSKPDVEFKIDSG